MARSAATFLVLAVLWPASAGAQIHPTFDVGRFDPSPHAEDVSTVRSARVEGRGVDAAVLVHAAADELVFVRPAGAAKQRQAVVRRHVGLEVLAGARVGGGVSLGLRIPVGLLHDGDAGFSGLGLTDEVGAGDAALGAKIALHQGAHWAVGLAADVKLPTGFAPAWRGDEAPSGLFQLLVQRDGAAGRFVLDVGARIREDLQLDRLRVRDELDLRFGWRSRAWQARVRLFADALAATDLRHSFADATTRYLEGVGGMQARLTDSVELAVGLGMGLGSAWGNARFRAWGGLRVRSDGASSRE